MAEQKGEKSALVLGCTGQVGRHIVRNLLKQQDFHTVQCLLRREVTKEDYFGDVANSDKLKMKVIDFEKWFDESNAEEHKQFQGFTHAFNAHGTTRSQAGGGDEFRHIDFDYSFSFAKFARRVGVQHFSLISSVRADSESFWLYTQTKGQLERDSYALGFSRFSTFRPGLLICPRDHLRVGEAFAQWLWPKIDSVLSEQNKSVTVRFK